MRGRRARGLLAIAIVATLGCLRDFEKVPYPPDGGAGGAGAGGAGAGGAGAGGAGAGGAGVGGAGAGGSGG